MRARGSHCIGFLALVLIALFAPLAIWPRSILVRYVWSDITPTSARFEQSFSDDGGKTWEPNWITTQVRVEK